VLEPSSSHIHFAFVTGATGLLGNNLVRALVARGLRVTALARSREKAERLLAGLPVEIVVGDIDDHAVLRPALANVDVLFHTAAYFRDSFTGAAGDHAAHMQRVNVEGTARLLTCAYGAGVRRLVHTSSTAVLFGPRGQRIDETMRREERLANDYGKSKIRSDRVIDEFLARHPDMFATLVLPGWMFGPGDAGPTPAGQFVLDFLRRKLPGIAPATFAVVDARDVADVMIAAALRGRRGERYIVAGRHVTMGDLFDHLQRVTGVPGPSRTLPMALVFLVAAANEVWARVSRRPALFNFETARLMARERNRSHYDHSKATRELGVSFRPFDETLRDVLRWYEAEGWLRDDTSIAHDRARLTASLERPDRTT